MAIVKKKVAVKKAAPRSKDPDHKQDMKTMKTFSPKGRAAFKKADMAMDKKKPSAKADTKMDKALAAKIKKQFPAKRKGK